jgi:NTP pyrophosphatase (non-canonical NTP hydrolase)
MLVAHTHANWVLSEIKLAVEDAAGDEPVVILQRLGTDEQAVVHTTWAELDRTVDADHLTCIYIPRLGAPVGADLVRFHQLARTLRERCPWDQEQTHETLVRYLVEETYEVVDALQALDPDDPATDDALVEELGDLLYQIEFHATIAEQEGRFTMADVARGVHDKLVRRHPHVFGDVDAADSDAVVKNWDAIKRAEKQRTGVFDGVAASQAVAQLRVHAAAQGGQGRVRLARRRGRAGEDPGGGGRGRRGCGRRRPACSGGRGRRSPVQRRQRRPAPRRGAGGGIARRDAEVPPQVRGRSSASRVSRAIDLTRSTSGRWTRCGDEVKAGHGWPRGVLGAHRVGIRDRSRPSRPESAVGTIAPRNPQPCRASGLRYRDGP